MPRRLILGGALVAFVVLSSGCPPRRGARPIESRSAAGPTTEGVSVPGPEDRGGSAKGVRDRRTGVQLVLPDAWTATGGRGDVIATAWGPGADPVRVQLRRWDGDPASLRPLMDRDPWSWSASGPYADIPVADGEPVVAAWRAVGSDDAPGEWIVFSWFFLVDGEGLGVLARVPLTSLEDGWRVAAQILASATRQGGS